MEEDEEKSRPKKKQSKPGVCYLSRIPPHLKPLKLRHLLSQHGEVLRVYLTPEDPSARKRRKRAGGNTGKNFTEGWVEFAKRKEAKYVAELLNGELMGGKKRSAYYYDIWNIKYLKKFSWNNLTEEIAYRRAVHDQKLAAEISAGKRERDFYLAQVERSKGVEAIKAKKRKRKEREAVENPNQEDKSKREKLNDEPEQRKLRKFNQKQAYGSTEGARGLAREVLAGVFSRKPDQLEST